MFEGYIGIRLWSGQLIEDALFTVLFVLFLFFAINARLHVKTFLKMFRCVGMLGKTATNTEMSTYYNKGFSGFMTFQTLLLCGIALFLYAYHEGLLYNLSEKKLVVSVLSFSLLMLVYYLLRRLVYHMLIFTFADAEFNKQWKLYYNSIIGVWGVTLYIPVIGQTFVGNCYYFAVYLFVFLYILCRFAIIYKSIRLFYTKKFDLFYLSLYLCAHEILPVFIMYKGFIYLCNFIEKSALWH